MTVTKGGMEEGGGARGAAGGEQRGAHPPEAAAGPCPATAAASVLLHWHLPSCPNQTLSTVPERAGCPQQSFPGAAGRPGGLHRPRASRLTGALEEPRGRPARRHEPEPRGVQGVVPWRAHLASLSFASPEGTGVPKQKVICLRHCLLPGSSRGLICRGGAASSCEYSY